MSCSSTRASITRRRQLKSGDLPRPRQPDHRPEGEQPVKRAREVITRADGTTTKPAKEPRADVLHYPAHGLTTVLVRILLHRANLADEVVLLEGSLSQIVVLFFLFRGRGKEWAEQELGLSVEAVHRTPKPTSEKTARILAQEWAKEGQEIDWQRLLPRRGF